MKTAMEIAADANEALGTRRLRVRRVADLTAEDITRVAALVASGRTSSYWMVRHGGSVANRYGYPAETEAVAVAAWVDGSVVRVAAGAARLPANKVTCTGAFAAAMDLPRKGYWWMEVQGRTTRRAPFAEIDGAVDYCPHWPTVRRQAEEID